MKNSEEAFKYQNQSKDQVLSDSVAKNYVQIRGQVKAPGDYIFKKEADIFHYLTQAGGSAARVVPEQLMLVRGTGPRKRNSKYNLQKLDQLPCIEGGDILIFHNISLGKDGPQTADKQKSMANQNETMTLLIDYIRNPQFKRLLNQIVTAQHNRQCKSVAVLSLFPGEGRTFLVSALALGFARFLNSRVLVMDMVKQANQRSLFFDRILGEQDSEKLHGKGLKQPGVIDLVTSFNLEKDTNDSNDFIIRSYLDSIAEDYDLILMDTCAIRGAGKDNVDPLIIARQTDSAILLTSKKSLNHEHLTELKRDLSRFKIDPLGTVHNQGYRK